MSDDAYASIEAVRSGDLSRLAVSPLHYRYPAPDKDTPARVVLRAAHALLLEPDTFHAEHVVYQGARRAGKEWDAFATLYADKAILKADEMAKIEAIGAGIRRHGPASRLLDLPGWSELTVTWTDPATGIVCKARLDRLGFDGQTYHLIDLKTYGTSNPRKVASMIAKMGAHVQAAHYVAALLDGCGIPAEQIKSYIISAEAGQPNDCAVLELEPDGALRTGQTERRRLLGLLAECRAADSWPGCCPEIVPAVLPVWANTDTDPNEGDDDESGALPNDNAFGPNWSTP
jgi:hypothetical protein